ncbi:MAG: TlpA family protein disulfide reductase, partial [Acidobacteria bacterium]|nr:TlpA family protein disulfide reductase [Acidobacteriota bacterium]
VLLDFWATWCGPCRIQAEVLEGLYPEYHPLGLEVLSIDVEEDEAQVRSFVEREKVPFHVLLDERGAVSGGFNVQALPTVVLLDGQGQIVFQRAGVTSERELRRILDRYVGGGSGTEASPDTAGEAGAVPPAGEAGAAGSDEGTPAAEPVDTAPESPGPDAGS